MRAARAAWQARQHDGRRERSRPRRRARQRGHLLAASAAVAGLAVLLAACGPDSSSGPSAAGTSAAAASPDAKSGTVTYAMPPDSTAGYIFPFVSIGQSTWFSVYNLNDFQMLMYRPLYWFGSGLNPYMNSDLSLAQPPTYSGQTVTIKLKSTYSWSNGEPVDADDVVFWMNMMIEENNPAVNEDGNDMWVGTTDQGLPNDISSVKAVSKYVVTMTIKGAYSPSWFTNNELSQITPMPIAWDRTAAGSSDCHVKVSSCAAVYQYLNDQAGASHVAGYATSPLWSVVDGPFKVKKMDTQGNVTLAFNDKYSGPVAKGHITTLVEVPFTSDGAEYNVLQDPTGSQAIDVGYLPTVDAPVPPAGASVGANPRSLSGYDLTAVYQWGLNYFPYNFANDTGQGAIFKQLYFRQAFQMLVDQQGIINGPLHGYGKMNLGPVQSYPVTSYLSPKLADEGDPWALNVPKARQTLLSHGWAAHGGGQPDTCVNPGPDVDAGQCGPGVRAGIPLTFSLMYSTGDDARESAARELQSNASLVGIKINLDPEPFGNVVGAAFDPKNHSWQLAEWGGWSYAPDYLPTGETLFATDSANNAGAYDDPRNDQLIEATLRAKTTSQFDSAMYTWENYVASQLPVVWTPNTPVLVESVKGLVTGQLNSALAIMPEMWYYQQ